jgi:hypothetical protein
LIWIKNRPEWMTHPAGMSPARPKIDTRPICGVAIEGSKSHVQGGRLRFLRVPDLPPSIVERSAEAERRRDDGE